MIRSRQAGFRCLIELFGGDLRIIGAIPRRGPLAAGPLVKAKGQSVGGPNTPA